MIKSATQIWEEISAINNMQIEFHMLNGVVPVLLVRDVFKQPDKVHDFLNTLDYWETRNFGDSSIVRPGLTHVFTEPLNPWLAKDFTQAFSKLFGVSRMRVDDIYASAMSGHMTLDSTDGLCCYPHIDSDVYDRVDDPEFQESILVANINLSKSVDPVSTGFWSWRGKHTSLDFTRDDKNSITNFYNRHEEQKTNGWFQVKDYEDFKFETTADMMYNSLVMYSTHYYHNPYILPQWFKDNHRLMMSIFYAFVPQDLDFEERDSELVSAAWEHFRLNTLFNYHPLQTTPQF